MSVKGQWHRPIKDREHYNSEHERILSKEKEVGVVVGKDGASASSFIERQSYVWSEKDKCLVRCD